jgi:hypothetical protein
MIEKFRVSSMYIGLWAAIAYGACGGIGVSASFDARQKARLLPGRHHSRRRRGFYIYCLQGAETLI